MGLTADLRVLYHLAFTRVRGANHADRLESFYEGQAGDYDDFRRRLLHGREEMIQRLHLPDGGRLVDCGGGTGSNLEVLADRLPRLKSVEIVDLCGPLLAVARERIARHGWNNVRTVQADATTYRSAVPVDAVTFSYALTMIPDWFRAIDQALAMLRPGGMIGVVDFYVSRKWPVRGLVRHSPWQRFFWPRWFARDDVLLCADHLPYLQSRFETVCVVEGLGRVPYLMGLKAPYYLFLGKQGMKEAVDKPWSATPRGRKELVAAGLFCTLNLIVPLFAVELFPFSRAPMFADAPRRYCSFTVFAPDGRTLPAANFALQRNYWGNPLGVGVGHQPHPTLEQFGDVPTDEEVRYHVAARLRRFPELEHVVVEVKVIGMVDGLHVGVQACARLNVPNPMRAR